MGKSEKHQECEKLSDEFNLHAHNLFGRCVSISQCGHSLFSHQSKITSNKPQNLLQCRLPLFTFWHFHHPLLMSYSKMHIKTW